MAMTGCDFVTAGDARSFPAALATVNSILQFHPDASITVITGTDEPLSSAQRKVLSRCERVRLSEDRWFALRSPRSFNAVLDAIGRRPEASDAAVAAWIAPGGVLCSPVDDVVDRWVERGVVVDSANDPQMMFAAAGTLGATSSQLDCFDTRLWSPREAHWQSVIDFRGGCFLNLSASGQPQRMFQSGDAHPFWARAHRDRILNDHPLQTYPYVWFLAMLWFGRCADWSLNPDDYLPEASRHLFDDLVHFLPQIFQVLPRSRYAWNALSNAMIARALEGIHRCLVLGDSMSDVLALVDLHPWIRRYVEIGSYEGGSILTLGLRFLNRDIDFYAVESFTGNLDGTADGLLLPSRRRFLDHLARFPSLRVRLVPGDSVHAAALFDDDSLDCVFIDGCHDTQAVLRDIDGWMPKLRRPAIIAGDDYDWDPVFEAVNTRFSHVNIAQHGAIWWLPLH